MGWVGLVCHTITVKRCDQLNDALTHVGERKAGQRTKVESVEKQQVPSINALCLLSHDGNVMMFRAMLMQLSVTENADWQIGGASILIWQQIGNLKNREKL